MEKSHKVLVYPFDIKFAPVLRHADILGNFEIAGLVSPSGWGLCRRDAGFADGGDDIGIIVNDNFEKSLDVSDTVLFVEPNRSLDFEKFIYPKILRAIKENKNIICNLKLEQDKLNELESIAKQKNIEFTYFSYEKVFNEKLIKVELYEIGVPVIFILGMSERTNKFELQLSLKEKLLSTGYKVSLIASRDYCELFGIHSFPQFMFDTSVSESSKIRLFNRYVKTIELKENPDIIIIGVPGGIMPFNSQFTNEFGVTAFEVSQAIRPDIAILSVFYDEYNLEYFNMISNSLKYKFGYAIDFYNMSNSLIDWMTSKEDAEIQHMTVKSDFTDVKVKKHRDDFGLPIYNTLNKKDIDSMAEIAINKLSGYADIECV
jgi:peptide maturation system protein (TIGR04066 family)